MLQKHSNAQPPSSKCPQIGDSNFQIEKQGSNLFKDFQDILKDPARPCIIEANNARLGKDKTGLGADTGTQPFLGRRIFSYESILPSTSNLERQQPTERATTFEDPEWARIQSPPNIEGLDDYQDIEPLMVDSIKQPTKVNPIWKRLEIWYLKEIADC